MVNKKKDSNNENSKSQGTTQSIDAMEAHEGQSASLKEPLVGQNISSNTIENAATTEMTLLDYALGLDLEPAETPQPQLDHNALAVLTDNVNSHYKCNNTGLAYAGILATLQAGGTNANKRSNVRITIAKTKFESKVINEYIRKTTKLSPRQLARLLANDIFKMAKKLNITGNAYIYIQRFHSQLLTDINSDEKFWASDFQIDNPNCDPNVRKALQARYADKFGARRRKQP